MNRVLLKMTRGSAFAAAALASAAWGTPALAAPPDQATKEACAAAYEETQALRKQAKLRAAREQALVCAQQACPAVVQVDCAKWLSEIEAGLPTLVFEVRDARGEETTDVRLSVDGEPSRERLDVTAIPMDPGEHVFRFEIDGAEPIERRYVIREGEKLRKISVSFAPAPAEGPAAPPPETPAGGGGAPALAFVLGGIGIAALGAAATLGLVGLGEKGDLEDTCAPRCTEDAVSSVRTKLILSDLALGVGVVSLGVSTVLFITAPDDEAPASASRRAPSRAPRPAAAALRLDLVPLGGGGFAQVRGAF